MEKKFGIQTRECQESSENAGDMDLLIICLK